MLKKFLVVFALALGMIFTVQVTDVPTVSALRTSQFRSYQTFNNYYVFSYNGVDYYVWYAEYDSEILGGEIRMKLNGVKNNRTVGEQIYYFDDDGTYSCSGIFNERGYIDRNSSAKKVYTFAVEHYKG